jgi:ABC-2 type transport system permease protein
VLDNEALVRKIQFPRMVIPLSVVLFSLLNLALNLVVVFIFAVIEGVRPMASWLELPLIVALLTVLAAGLSMLLSSLFIYFRDVQPIWEVISQILFYASPVIVPLATVEAHLSSTLVKLYMMSPLATVFQQFRHAVINHAAPSVPAVLGSGGLVAIPVGIALAVFALGFYVFNRTAPYVAENL